MFLSKVMLHIEESVEKEFDFDIMDATRKVV